MSNAVETELRGLINELQGLYRQCAADIAEMKRKIAVLKTEKIVTFKTFFESMKKRIEEKIGKFEYTWKIDSIEHLEKRLDREIGEYFDPRCASSKGQRRLIDLVDIANQAMFIWIRRNKKDDKSDYWDYYNDVINKGAGKT